MGFGLMFFGTVFFVSAKIGNFDILPDVVGYILILYGIRCASRYCKNFRTAKVAAIFGAAVSVVTLATQVLELFGAAQAGTAAVQLIEAANQASRIVFIMILLLSIFGLAKETGAEKTEKRTLMSAIVVPVFWTAYIVIGVLNYVGVVTDEKILAGALLCEIVYVGLTAIGVFSAYMWICVEGDEDMPKRNNSRSPMDYFDRRREREAAEDEERRKKQTAEAAGKTVTQMYGVKKKKKKGK